MPAPEMAFPTVQSAAELLRSFTGFDWLLSLVLLWLVVRGLLRGLIREIFAILGLVAGVLVASWNYPAFAGWLAQWIPNLAYASLAAFVLLAAGVSVGVLLLGRLVRSAARLAGLGLLDRLGGALFGALRAALLGAAILMACLAFLPIQPAITNSRLAPPLRRIAAGWSFLTPDHLRDRIAAGLARLPRFGGSAQ